MEDISYMMNDYEFFTEDPEYFEHSNTHNSHKVENLQDPTPSTIRNQTDAYSFDFESIKNRRLTLSSQSKNGLIDPTSHCWSQRNFRWNSINIDYVDDYDYSKVIKHKIDLDQASIDNEFPENHIRLDSIKLSSKSEYTSKTEDSLKLLQRGESNVSKTSTSVSNFTSIEDMRPVFLVTRFRGENWKFKKVDSKTGKVKFYPKHRKLITNCNHRNEEYYAKGMCKNCYHNKGQKSKKAFMCPHSSKSHYARGLCKNCYLYHYHQNKKSSEFDKLAEFAKKSSE